MSNPTSTCVLLLALMSARAGAEDSSTGVMLPGLRSSPAGSVMASSSRLVLKNGQVELSLSVTARGPSAYLLIQMPRFGWLGEAETYPERQFPELKILVDGAAVAIEDTFNTFVGSTDITDQIRKAGLDPFAITDTPPFVGSKGGASLEALARLGAVENYQGRYLAKWTAARKVKVQLRAGSHSLTLTYKSRPALDLLRFDQISKPAFLAKYCLTTSDLTGALGRVALSSGRLWSTNIALRWPSTMGRCLCRLQSMLWIKQQ